MKIQKIVLIIRTIVEWFMKTLEKIYLLLLRLDASGFFTRAINYQMLQCFSVHSSPARRLPCRLRTSPHCKCSQFTLQNLISAFKRVHRELERLNCLVSKNFVLDFYLSQNFRVLCCHISSSKWIIHKKGELMTLNKYAISENFCLFLSPFFAYAMSRRC